jgi:hypothetical protein
MARYMAESANSTKANSFSKKERDGKLIFQFVTLKHLGSCKNGQLCKLIIIQWCRKIITETRKKRGLVYETFIRH